MSVFLPPLPPEVTLSQSLPARTPPRTSPAVRLSSEPTAPVEVTKDSRFSSDFEDWLRQNGYGGYAFAQGDVPSFGGRARPGEKLAHEPVLFIHGNSDSAAGWEKSIEHFAAQGYQPSELYAMTWGSQNPLNSGQEHHSRKNEEEVRAFIQAVKEYTGAEKVDIIGHSMGVTLARKAIQGGDGFDPYAGGGRYNLGAPLTDAVDTFVGIAGANQGLASCALTGDLLPTSNRQTGLHPQSKFLEELNAQPGFEGDHVYSIWSQSDQIVGVGLAQYTSPIPGQDGQKVYTTYGHMGSRDLSVQTQLEMVQEHKVR